MRAGRPDVVMLAALGAILAMGLLAVLSAGRAVPGDPVFLKQCAWLAAGGLVFWFASSVSLRLLEEFSYAILAAISLLLLLTVFLGSGPAGRWLILGPLRLQPSELAKVGVILAAARAFSDLKASPRRFGVFLLFLGAAPVVLLTWLQPDLGTAAAMVIILLLMTWWAGYGPDWIFLLLSPLLAALSSRSLVLWLVFTALLCVILYRRRASIAMWLALLAGNSLVAAFTPVAWNLLRPYQQARLTTFLNPAADPHGAGWNVIQSEVAIGSGGLWGQGLFHGSQKGLAFLPARHTDFIFSVWAEEMGFAGAVLLVGAFTVLILRMVRAARLSANSFRSMTAVGAACYFLVHLFVNAGMTLGIMPVTGIPLVLVSYGGSHMISAMFVAGLGMNVAVNWREL